MLLDEILNIPLNNEKYYIVAIPNEFIAHVKNYFEAIVFSHENTIVLLGAASSPIYFEVAERSNLYGNFTFETLKNYDLLEVSKEKALDFFRLYLKKETEYLADEDCLSANISKRFVVEALLNYTDSFGELIASDEKNSITTMIKNISHGCY